MNFGMLKLLTVLIICYSNNFMRTRGGNGK
uniref:U-limacoditoxin(12)-Dv72 n=1 Tax=Doratifera vulnerans TaxID=1372962 RepID=UC72_DORVU|nr:RecName: Full=U-limacoditoxin(12)-Dv72; Short=U-LCTX(12)-Dv72; AltName: Full=Vulnericin; Flags: Precursor [Doratifera vulnerans]QTY40855.1 venom polypeptide precursor [Doratifera vulnerans]